MHKPYKFISFTVDGIPVKLPESVAALPACYESAIKTPRKDEGYQIRGSVEGHARARTVQASPSMAGNQNDNLQAGIKPSPLI